MKILDKIRRGDIFYVDLGTKENRGSEQSGLRPWLIVQNDRGNIHSPTVIGVPITSKTSKTRLPTHIEFVMEYTKDQLPSLILCEQIRTIDKSRLKDKIGTVSMDIMKKVNKALRISIGLDIKYNN